MVLVIMLKKISVWSTNKYLNELDTVVSVAFSEHKFFTILLFTLHWRRYAECCQNCSMLFIWIFVGAPNVHFSTIITSAKHRLTLRILIDLSMPLINSKRNNCILLVQMLIIKKEISIKFEKWVIYSPHYLTDIRLDFF